MVWCGMKPSEREKLLVYVARALTIYAVGRSENRIPPSVTPHKFVLDAVPESARGGVTADVIDEVFAILEMPS